MKLNVKTQGSQKPEVRRTEDAGQRSGDTNHKSEIINHKSALLLLILAFTTLALSGLAQTVTTDQADYPPGGLVIITGGGFAPGEMVQLQVLHIPDSGDNNTSPAHQPWLVTADADANPTSP